MNILFYHPRPNYNDILTLRKLLAFEIKEFDFKFSDDIQVIENAIATYQPDVFLTHCHTNDNDFERIKNLTKEIRKKLKGKCTIFLLFNNSVDQYYVDYLNRKEYETDYTFATDDTNLGVYQTKFLEILKELLHSRQNSVSKFQ